MADYFLSAIDSFPLLSMDLYIAFWQYLSRELRGFPREIPGHKSKWFCSSCRSKLAGCVLLIDPQRSQDLRLQIQDQLPYCTQLKDVADVWWRQVVALYQS